MSAKIYFEIMSIETIQPLVLKALVLWPLLIPAWLIGAFLGIGLRGRRWLTPIWAFLACQVIGLFLLIGWMVFATSRLGTGPEAGLVGMGTALSLYLAVPFVLSGLFLLATFPPRRAWNAKVSAAAAMAALLSGTLTYGYMVRAHNPFEPPRSVQLVIPNNFRGLIVIDHGVANGVEPQRTGGVTRYDIPASGQLMTTDVDPFFSWHEDFATYASGEELPDPETAHQRVLKRTARPKTSKAMQDRAFWKETETCFHSLGSAGSRHLFFVGTPSECQDFQRNHNPW